jgi:elongation factor 1-gamma
VDAAKAATTELLGHLNEILLSRTFLVGERLSLADLSVAFNLLPAFQHVLDEGARKSAPAVTRWFKTVMGQSEVAAVVGSLSLCSKPAQFDAKKFADSAPAPKGGKKEAKKSESEKGSEKKAPKKKEAKKSECEPEEPEDEFAEPPKKGDPFDKYPKPKFNLEEFKRIYSNEDTETKAIPYLLDNIDWENWSLWTGTYKFAEDLGLVFMSCNLISGMMQRLDKMRKNCFASICLFGENNNSTITGLWLWRGDELAFELSPDWQVDYESYDWTKVDPKAESTKKLIKEYLTWEGDFDGKKFNQGKIFK